MDSIDKIIEEVIPPANHESRNGFSNKHLILNLNEFDKKLVEKRLIRMLETKDDNLIGESLAILKSKESLPTLRKRLESAKSSISKIIWASFINEIHGDDMEMKELALKEFNCISDRYSLIIIFQYLIRFRDTRINEKIKSYINDSDYLTAYNARIALGIDTNKIENK